MNVKSLPIIVVHYGSANYLNACLEQAMKQTPDSPVILLGDESNLNVPCTEHWSIHDSGLGEDLERFHASFQNLGDPHRETFERFCIERWFLVRNFCRLKGWTRCLHFDSDVLLFCNAEEEAKRFQNYAMTFAHWDPVRNLVHCNFVQNLAALEDFCQYVLNVYETPELLEALKVKNRKKSGFCWISDMSLFADWSRNAPFPFAFFEDFYDQGFCFDPAIDQKGTVFRQTRYLPGLLRGFKKIRFQAGVPFAQMKDGRWIQLKAIHYHGTFKYLIVDHARGVHRHLRTFLHQCLDKIRTVPGKFRLLLRFRTRSAKERKCE